MSKTPYTIEGALEIVERHYPKEAQRIRAALDPENPVNEHHEAHSMHVVVRSLRGTILHYLDSHEGPDPVEQVVTILASLIHDLNNHGYKRPNEHLLDAVCRHTGSPSHVMSVDEEESSEEAPKPARKAKPKSKPATKPKGKSKAEDSEE